MFFIKFFFKCLIMWRHPYPYHTHFLLLNSTKLLFDSTCLSEASNQSQSITGSPSIEGYTPPFFRKKLWCGQYNWPLKTAVVLLSSLSSSEISEKTSSSWISLERNLQLTGWSCWRWFFHHRFPFQQLIKHDMLKQLPNKHRCQTSN